MTKPKALGVHIFAGGFTVGMQKHFDVLAHFENGDYGVDTVKLNFPDLPVYTDPETWPCHKCKGIDLVYGNPPCAPFSVNNKSGISWEDDERIEFIHQQFELIPELKPKAWVWESVTGAYSEKKGRPLVDSLVKRANMMGYHVSILLFDAQYLGLPQRRKRFFFVAHNVEIPWTEIRPKEPIGVGYWLDELDDTGEPYWKGMERGREWIGDVPPGKPIRYTYDKLMEEGKIEKVVKANGHIKGRPAWAIIRLHYEDVAPTMVGYHWVHPVEPRPLSMKEYAHIQTFPPDYKFAGAPGTWLSQMARGVLPAVGDWLGGLIAAGVKANVPVGIPSKSEVNLVKPKLVINRWRPQLTLFPQE